jgi:hypothetical protein
MLGATSRLLSKGCFARSVSVVKAGLMRRVAAQAKGVMCEKTTSSHKGHPCFFTPASLGIFRFARTSFQSASTASSPSARCQKKRQHLKQH